MTKERQQSSKYRKILITGGCRSGKSNHARGLAISAGGRKAYIATAPIVDEEMRQRIEEHREERHAEGWDVIEETLDLAGAIVRSGEYDVVVIDCLTLWIHNLMHEAATAGHVFGEKEIASRSQNMLLESSRGAAIQIFVTNEVGMGIVPENPAARAFRDLSGRCNQVIAAAADEVILMTTGIPLVIKGR